MFIISLIFLCIVSALLLSHFGFNDFIPFISDVIRVLILFCIIIVVKELTKVTIRCIQTMHVSNKTSRRNAIIMLKTSPRSLPPASLRCRYRREISQHQGLRRFLFSVHTSTKVIIEIEEFPMITLRYINAIRTS